MIASYPLTESLRLSILQRKPKFDVITVSEPSYQASYNTVYSWRWFLLKTNDVIEDIIRDLDIALQTARINPIDGAEPFIVELKCWTFAARPDSTYIRVRIASQIF